MKLFYAFNILLYLLFFIIFTLFFSVPAQVYAVEVSISSYEVSIGQKIEMSITDCPKEFTNGEALFQWKATDEKNYKAGRVGFSNGVARLPYTIGSQGEKPGKIFNLHGDCEPKSGNIVGKDLLATDAATSFHILGNEPCSFLESFSSQKIDENHYKVSGVIQNCASIPTGYLDISTIDESPAAKNGVFSKDITTDGAGAFSGEVLIAYPAVWTVTIRYDGLDIQKGNPAKLTIDVKQKLKAKCGDVVPAGSDADICEAGCIPGMRANLDPNDPVYKQGKGGDFVCHTTQGKTTPDDNPTPTLSPPPPPCESRASDGSCNKTDSAIGPLATKPEDFVLRLFTFLLALSGGLAVLLIMAGGYKYMTSQGNPEAVKGAQEMIVSAIAGLLFMIFAFIILQVIGVDILKIPGFG